MTYFIELGMKNGVINRFYSESEDLAHWFYGKHQRRLRKNRNYIIYLRSNLQKVILIDASEIQIIKIRQIGWSEGLSPMQTFPERNEIGKRMWGDTDIIDKKRK